jgi:hypothetical protein
MRFNATGGARPSTALHEATDYALDQVRVALAAAD